MSPEFPFSKLPEVQLKAPELGFWFSPLGSTAKGIHFQPPHARRRNTHYEPIGNTPRETYQNQTDYIFCSQRWRSSIQSAKTRLEADYGLDHELLIAKFRLKLKKVGKTTRRRDGGAWWAAVYGFAQSWTRLKQVSSSSSSSSRENH